MTFKQIICSHPGPRCHTNRSSGRWSCLSLFHSRRFRKSEPWVVEPSWCGSDSWGSPEQDGRWDRSAQRDKSQDMGTATHDIGESKTPRHMTWKYVIYNYNVHLESWIMHQPQSPWTDGTEILSELPHRLLLWSPEGSRQCTGWTGSIGPHQRASDTASHAEHIAQMAQSWQKLLLDKRRQSSLLPKQQLIPSNRAHPSGFWRQKHLGNLCRGQPDTASLSPWRKPDTCNQWLRQKPYCMVKDKTCTSGWHRIIAATVWIQKNDAFNSNTSPTKRPH